MRSLLSASAALILLFLSTGLGFGQVKTFTVTVETKTSEHPYDGEGNFEGFVIDGTQGKELTLEKGKTYDFEIGSGVGEFHPFYISRSPTGAGARPYSDGVVNNNATEGETLTFTPPSGAPDSLWYQCGNHRKMGWRMALVEDSSQASVNADGTVSFSGTGVAINFSGTSGSGSVTVDKFGSEPNGQTGISESNVSDYRFVIEAEASLTFNSSTEVRFDVSTLQGIADPSDVTIYSRSTVGSGSFTELSTSYDSGANELVATTGSFSEFVMASNSQGLPVEMVDFDAQTDGATAQLVWQTAAEQNNAGFEVQRKVLKSGLEKGSWTTLTFVESKADGGSTTEPHEYRFRDDTLPFEANRVDYRLKQVDTDGSSHLSGVVTVEFDAPQRLALRPAFPNPTTGPATIRYELPRTTTVRLTLYSALGQKVATLVNERQPAGRKEVQLETPPVTSGSYFLRLTAGGQTRTRTLTVVR